MPLSFLRRLIKRAPLTRRLPLIAIITATITVRTGDGACRRPRFRHARRDSMHATPFY